MEQKGISISFQEKKKSPIPSPGETVSARDAQHISTCSRAQKKSCCILLHIRREAEWEIQVFAAGIYAAGLELESLWRGGHAWSVMNWAAPEHPSSPVLVLGDALGTGTCAGAEGRATLGIF